MKKILLIAYAVFLSASSLVAQCTIDASQTTIGPHPSTLPNACLNEAYSEEMTLVFPADTVVGGFTIALDSVIVLNITNLPAGITYTCGTPTCTAFENFPNPTRYCLLFSGTPTSAPVSDSIGIDLQFWVTLFGSPNSASASFTAYLPVFSTPDTTVNQVGSTLTAGTAGVSYQWLDCNNGFAAIPGATNQSFIPATGGSYALSIFDGSCADTSACYPVGFMDLYENDVFGKITAYPNPTNGQLTIDLGDPYSSALINVKSIDGKLISSEKYLSSTLVHIEMPAENGTYLIEVSTSKGAHARFRILKH